MSVFGGLFKKTKYIKLNVLEDQKEHYSKANVPDGLYIRCKACGSNWDREAFEENKCICSACGHHHRLSPLKRIELMLDEGSFQPMFETVMGKNHLDFPDYDNKLVEAASKGESSEAVVCGLGRVGKIPIAVGFMDPSFMMGSMGSAVGERITQLIEYASAHTLPLVLVTASGGARMQEGIFSLMQMAKTSIALAEHHRKGGLYISLLTDPTTGGVTASYAMLGDIILAEPGALIGFAGPRVIEQTIRQKLPEGFQTSEFLLAHGFIDRIVEREALHHTLKQILVLHGGRSYEA